MRWTNAKAWIYSAATLPDCRAKSRSRTVLQPALRLALCFLIHAVIRETFGISELQRRIASPVHICCASEAKLEVDNAEKETATARIKLVRQIVVLIWK